jgi:hypothetical protein
MSFPTDLFTKTTKSAGDTITSAHYNTFQDELVNVQTKVGINSSAVVTSHDYLLRNIPDQESDCLINTDKKVQFRDSAIYIQSDVDGYINIVADIGVKINGRMVSVGGWIKEINSATRTGNHVFTLPVDATDVIGKGTRIKYKEAGGSDEYGVVISATESGGVTTVTLATNTDYTMAGNPVDGLWYSNEASPVGYPTWFVYAPSYAGSGSMTFTSVSSTLAKFSVAGLSCTVCLLAVGTTGGTASNTLKASLPIPCDADNGDYRYGAVSADPSTSVSAFAFIDSNYIQVRKGDASNYGLGANRGMGGTFIYGI